MSLKKEVKNIGIILMGSMILAFGLYNITNQNNITEGGVLGLTLLLDNTLGISPSVSNIIIDLLLFFIGIRFLGKKFLFYSIIATCSFSLFYGLNELRLPILPDLTNNMFLASIMSALFVGIGVGLVVRVGGAAGGDDVLALVIPKISKVKVGTVYLVSDLIVLALSLIYLDFTQIFWSILTVIISGKIINYIYYFDSNKIIKIRSA